MIWSHTGYYLIISFKQSTTVRKKKKNHRIKVFAGFKPFGQSNWLQKKTKTNAGENLNIFFNVSWLKGQ